jgi:hypothetical protein
MPVDIPIPYTMYGYFVFEEPTKEVEFSLLDWPISACEYYFGLWINILQEVLYYPPYAADLTRTVYVDFDTCVTGTTLVFMREIQINGACDFGGLDDSPPARALGCDDVWRPITDLTCDQVPPPSNLIPENGAEYVSLSPSLEWSWGCCGFCTPGIGITFFNVHIGTHPDSLVSTNQTGLVESPWPVGPLEPNTTYYWYVSVHSSYYSCPGSPNDRSPLHIFTTGDAVPVVPTTLGGLKGLFKKE